MLENPYAYFVNFSNLQVVVKAVPVVPDIPHELIPYWVMERH